MDYIYHSNINYAGSFFSEVLFQMKINYFKCFEFIIGFMVLICGCLMLNYKLNIELEHVLISCSIIIMGLNWMEFDLSKIIKKK